MTIESPVLRPRLVVLLLVVAAAIGGTWWWWSGRIPPLPDAEARRISEAFLSDLREGKADAAWAGTTAEFKSIQGRDTFRAYVKSNPALRAAAEFQSCQFVETNGLHLAVCHFRPAKGAGTIMLTLAPEQRTWKVERLAVE